MSPVLAEIRPEMIDDYDSIRRVYVAAFGGELEADLVEALRLDGRVTVSLAAILREEVIGHILFSPVTIEKSDGPLELLSLAPMAVLPQFQRTGMGTALVEAGMRACHATNFGGIVVLGHAKFYRRFGFSSELARTLKSPFGAGESWMAFELVPGALQGIAGTVVYPPPFQVFK